VTRQDLAQHSGPHQQKARTIYTELRRNIISTVYNSWRDTGFAWEQYNPENGAGQRTQHFTGWTALVVKIMAFPDLAETPMPAWDQPDSNALSWNRTMMIMMIVLIGMGVVFRRKLMVGWRRAMGWTRIRARD
jgi:peptidoglycan biosynthesis protein MviN/MurJ (putative lipid II flippase)